MPGAGSMLHAIVSLRENKRSHTPFPTKDFDKSIGTTPLVFKKASQTERTKAAQHLEQIKNNENTRLMLVFFIIATITITLLAIYFLNR
ncbi:MULTISPECIES: hypothetical protein [unclassified Aureispira]|uniref:hypothetical protein n=1 Tax=unclassified Aureispira TaxID=2649989 RepID=UPI000695D0CF|nr:MULTISPECIES: hypothetical protein [unclassified Aureispira]WMX14137.1 hypothetical protein QP953_25100 [Aureispira sp. CCB-E]